MPPPTWKITTKPNDKAIDAYMDKFRKRSGTVNSSDPLTSFLYTLMRDYVTPGNIEEIMLSHMPTEPGAVTEFSNGWLALHALDISRRIHALGSKHSVKPKKR